MQAKREREYKSMITRKAQLEADRRGWEIRRQEAEKQMSKIDVAIRNIDSNLKNYSDKEVTISDHAIARFVERQMHITPHMVKQRILSKNVKAAIETLVTGKIQHEEGFLVVFKNKNVVTVE